MSENHVGALSVALHGKTYLVVDERSSAPFLCHSHLTRSTTYLGGAVGFSEGCNMAERPLTDPPKMRVSLTRQTGLRAEASGRFGIAATALVVVLLAIIAFGIPH